MTAALATIGHNQPPAPTLYEAAQEQVADLRTEAANWLDGSPITSQGDADAVAQLLDLARKAEKETDAARKVEAKPFDDGKAEVQARYKPLLDSAGSVAAICKKALGLWLVKLDAEKREAARRARDEAEAAERVAQAAFKLAAATDLEAREQAESFAKTAAAAQKSADRADRDKAHAKGGSRAVTLRTTYRAEITDATAFARWVWANHRDELLTFLAGIAQRRAEAKFRDMPGVVVHEDRVAV